MNSKFCKLRVAPTVALTIALTMAGAAAPAYAQGDHSGGHRGGFGGGFHRNALGGIVGLGLAGLAVGAIVGAQSPYYGDCYGDEPLYDRYGRQVARC